MVDLFDKLPKNAAQSAWQGDWKIDAVSSDWHPFLQRFMQSHHGQALQQWLQERLQAGAVIYPPQPFRALELTSLKDVCIVILGQDPYHGPGQAEGLAYSVAAGLKIPPSLRNIYKERQSDLGVPAPAHGSLISWAQQGILLLNTCLTVEDGQPASHAKRGWEMLTDSLIAACAEKSTPVVFMLWGAHAQTKRSIIAAHNGDARHLVLSANHPSPLSALRPPEPFIGCGHFAQAQRWLAPHHADAKALFE